ncbi:protein usf-like [Pecten maximus]|uniref:protein usf-like n=1 Tax=Pecten maximus TaxID=6579 RepID=UPI00145891FC|nr:protein usf-like [Pecten maximus]XP_033727157.1 protein usf-like [Pecten maximus]XP_033727158.1 protein usf-like [Pecten maximus]XP_033727160.1 protein usf-like [Pecten maximus]XP_033727161.1 protein usf-like [Pecten maximus]XP_033727162.1 protein usf-like [Pecten maximus]
MASTRPTFPSQNKLGSCPYVITGDISKTKKGLIVLQEWWGLNDQIQNEASMIGGKGNFVTIVPDLYRGKVAIDNEQAGHYMGDLDWLGAIDDIAGAARELKTMGCEKVGVTGFCMGGALSLAAAALVPEIQAAAPFYGISGDGLADLSKITIPLQCHFGANDAVEGFSCPKSQAKLKEKLDRGGVKYEFHSYQAGHAFTNPTSDNYNKECCDLAIGRMVEFMTKNLK